MLKQLYIENIAVIEQAELVLYDGFHVLSGETGAGKSIIIDALNALSGGRISRELIRTGQEKAYVSAIFCKISPASKLCAEQLGYSLDQDELVLSREMYLDGRNICRIGGKPASLSMLKSLAPLLFSIHGQHDGQHLLNELLHIDYLDSFAGLGNTLTEYQTKYEALLALNRQIRASSLSTEEKAKRREVVSFQSEELKNAQVSSEEWDNLLTIRRELAHSEKITAGLHAASEALEEQSAVTLLSTAAQALAASAEYAPGLIELRDRANELFILGQELSRDLADAISRVSFSPEALEQTENRIAELSRLARKHGVEPQELPTRLAELEEELSHLGNYENNLEEMKAEYGEQRKAVLLLAQRLHTLREKAAAKLSSEIVNELGQLGMSSASFIAEIEPASGGEQIKFTKKGIDTVRFLLAANKGEEPRALSRVASGGELSRIMLAIKSVLTGNDDLSDIFDEIDSGVSGIAANRVGEKLYDISRSHQVICITHLPQIAALADHHFRVTKEEQSGRTFTRVTLLQPDGRAEELGRLTGGRAVTDAALENAKDMLRQAADYKRTLSS